RHQQQHHSYDILHRLSRIRETDAANITRVSARCSYGDADASAGHNMRGRLILGWSPAGLNIQQSYDIAGQPLAVEQKFLRDEVLNSDWAGDSQAAWANDLAPETYTSSWRYSALGQELERTDACGNRQRQHYNIAGQLAASELQLAGQAVWQTVLRTIHYNAAGQVLQETAGNGVITDYSYEAQTQRLAALHCTRPSQAGRDS
ncbi:hypothetical protein ACWGP3_22700, partial [Shewanella oncorhynchi]